MGRWPDEGSDLDPWPWPLVPLTYEQERARRQDELQEQHKMALEREAQWKAQRTQDAKANQEAAWAKVCDIMHRIAWCVHAGVLDCHVRELTIELIDTWKSAFPDVRHDFPGDCDRPDWLSAYKTTVPREGG